MNLMRGSRELLSNMKLKNKLHLSFVLFLMLPLVTFTFLFYSRTSETLREQTIVTSQLIFGEAAVKLENKSQNMINIVNQFTLNTNLNSILSKPSFENIVEQLNDYNTIVTFLENLERSQEGLRVQIYLNDHFEETSDNQHTFLMQTIRDSPWFHRMVQSSSSLNWFTTDDNGSTYLSVGRSIWDLKNLTHRVGVIKVDIPVELVQDIMSQALIDQNGQAILIGEDGTIAALASSKPLLNPDKLDGLTPSRLSNEILLPRQSMSADPHDYIYYERTIAGTDWTLESVIPLKSVLRHITLLRNQMLLILLSIAILGYLIALYAANISTKRIGRLIRKMRNLHVYDLEPLVGAHGKDEIGELINNFNMMTVHIKQLIQERFESGQLLKNTELRLLQSQINPHFLYNSLDVINIMATEHQAPDISRMVRALSTFYKLGLNNGKDFVTVRDELEHIRVYVQIQNIRFDNGIQLTMSVAEDCLECRVHKLVLQPLVENSILHGILEKRERKGEIHITAEKTGQQLILNVQDDGVGMTESASQNLLTRPLQSDSGFGMRNVNERIRLSFGEQYGLKVKSALNEGTKITISLPLIDE